MFGKSPIFGDRYYDFAKLLYSAEGSYDNFNKRRFELVSCSSNEFYLTLPQSQYKKYAGLIYEHVDKPERLMLIHSLVWFGLCGYVKDHIDSIVGAFLRGVVIYSQYKDFLKTKTDSVTLSSLPKTWIFDIDGTLVPHNGHKFGAPESFLAGVLTFLMENVKCDDVVLLATNRTEKESSFVVDKIRQVCSCEVRIIASLPVGERLIFNDQKPSGLKTAYAFNLGRDKGVSSIDISIDSSM